MTQPLLVVAKSTSKFNKFAQASLLGALNIRDFLEQTGEYDEVAIFQLKGAEGPLKEWVVVNEIDR